MKVLLTQSRIVRFGVFEIDLQERYVRRSGLRQKLGPQPFQVLEVLLERAGEIVTRDELRDRLWPDKTFVDHELALKKCVNRIREVLGDSAVNPRFIETVPRRGYRFIAPVQAGDVTPSSEDALAGAAPSAPTHYSFQARWSKGRWTIVVAAAVIVAASALVSLRAVPPSSLVVEGIRQLTDDRLSKAGFDLETDGNRVYFNEGSPGNQRIMEVSVSGGQTAQIAAQLVNPELVGLQADGSALLALAGNVDDMNYPLWSIPLPAGEPRRLGSAKVGYADVFRDGHLLYTEGSIQAGGPSSLYMAERDGSRARKVAEMPQRTIIQPHASPDGKKINFGTVGADGSEEIYEVGADGAGLHEVVRGGQGGLPSHVCCAKWTADGQYLIFQAQATAGRWDLWALPEYRGPFDYGTRRPFRLTNGPLSYDRLAPSRDGRSIFTVGSQRRSELVRYDAGLRQFVPFLDGISAVSVTFSQDGEWVAYVSYPDLTLWRSHTDGTERVQLSYPPMVVRYPHLSPDGSRISFNTPNGDVFVIASAGGEPQKIVNHAYAPTWSPDGNRMIYMSAIAPDNDALELRTLDLRTGTTTIVPDSKDKIGAFFVDQDTIVAAAENTTKLLLYDFKTQKWSDLWSGNLLEWYLSTDRKYLYCTIGDELTAIRIRLSDRKVETIAGLKNLRLITDFNTLKLSVAPDDSPLFTRDIGTQEVYALNLK
jgi:DNA-binding winged helix-turn-helix (wHTH) protein/Tol biopolymer transport system component